MDKEDKLSAAISNISIVVSRIKRENRQAKKLHKTVTGTTICPACGASLGYRIDGYRWHSSGTCSTPGCLSWRE